MTNQLNDGDKASTWKRLVNGYPASLVIPHLFPTPCSMPNLIVIGGPTASGKTQLAIDLARYFDTIILSADSRQFYREMRIGNARPTDQELAAATHFFVADRSINEPLSAGQFGKEALQLLAEKFKQYENIVLVGGSGLYIDAVTQGLNEFPRVDVNTKGRVDQLLKFEGLAGLQKALKSADPLYFAEVDQNNPRRIQRALEVSWASGRPYSSFLTPREKRPFSSYYFQPDLSALPREDYHQPVSQSRNAPEPDRLNLYARIEKRLDAMLDQGLLDEVQALYDYRELPVLQTVGYQEFFPYLSGETDLEYATELAKRNSRRYAKRQVTWFNREGKYLAVNSTQNILKELSRVDTK